MNKHAWAIAFALIGFGVSGFIAEDFNFTSITLGLCIGAFVGYFVAGLMQTKGDMLQHDFAKLGDLRGKSLEEIVAKVGVQTSFSACTITDRNNEPGFFYTWVANNYSITLLFDSEKKCIGVHSETKI